MHRLLPATLLLCSALASAQRSRDASVGVWPWLVGNVDSFQDEILARAKSTGLDTVYMHVWRTTGSRQGELRIVDEAKSWKSADGRLLPMITLSRFIQKAHAANIQVVAVVQIFRDNALPNDYGHQAHMLERVIRYLVHSYDQSGRRFYPIDGIALDYIRWFGGNHDGRHVNRFLDELRKEVGPLPIHAFLIASAWYIDGPPYTNSFRSYAEAMSILTRDFGQNWQDFARRIDCLMPMAYTASGHVYGTDTRYMEGYLNAVARYARQAVTNAQATCRIKPAIRTWTDGSATTTRATVEACARGAMTGGADGFMAFRYFTARAHADWFQGLAGYAEPGADLPVAELSGSVTGIELKTSTTGSKHAKFEAAKLAARFDLNGDGRFDTAPVALGSRNWIASGAGRQRIAMQVRDPAGRTAVTGIQVSVADFMKPTLATVSAARGGNVGMLLSPGFALSGGYYFIVSTLSGTSPGTPLGHVTLPINFDYFTFVATGLINVGPFQNFFGTINGAGFATPTFAVPPGLAGLVGTKFWFAALDVDPTTYRHRYASNAVEVRIVP